MIENLKIERLEDGSVRISKFGTYIEFTGQEWEYLKGARVPNKGMSIALGRVEDAPPVEPKPSAQEAGTNLWESIKRHLGPLYQDVKTLKGHREAHRADLNKLSSLIEKLSRNVEDLKRSRDETLEATSRCQRAPYITRVLGHQLACRGNYGHLGQCWNGDSRW